MESTSFTCGCFLDQNHLWVFSTAEPDEPKPGAEGRRYLPGCGGAAAPPGRTGRPRLLPRETQLDHFVPVYRNRLLASSFLSLICYCPLVEIGWLVTRLPKHSSLPRLIILGLSPISYHILCDVAMLFTWISTYSFAIQFYSMQGTNIWSLQLITNVVLCLGVEQTSLLINVLYKGNCRRCSRFRLRIIQSCRVRILKWTLCVLPAPTSLVQGLIFSRSRNTDFLLFVFLSEVFTFIIKSELFKAHSFQSIISLCQTSQIIYWAILANQRLSSDRDPRRWFINET